MGKPSKDENQAQHVAGRGQDGGRQDNAAQPPETMDQDVDPASYPPTKRDEAVELTGEGRSFDPSVNAPTPRRGADDGGPAEGGGRIGRDGDPAEGKRD